MRARLWITKTEFFQKTACISKIISVWKYLMYFNIYSHSKQIERRGILSFDVKLVINVERYVIFLINYRACSHICRSQETLRLSCSLEDAIDVFLIYKTINNESIITGSINFF